jgi:hypothetical protein
MSVLRPTCAHCGGILDYLYHVWYRCRSCGAFKSWVPKR